MIRNIVFDMGNVLIRFDREFFLSRLGIVGEDAVLLMREVFLSVEWAQMDRGTLTDDQASEIICRRVPAHLHEAVHKLVTMWDRPILPIPGMLELVEELKERGFGIYLLSNASVRQHEYWPRYEGSALFDGTLISSDVKCIKPLPEIYQMFCDKFFLKSEECLFVDDLPVNVESAMLCGMDGIAFHGDAAELRQKMVQKGILP